MPLDNNDTSKGRFYDTLHEVAEGAADIGSRLVEGSSIVNFMSGLDPLDQAALATAPIPIAGDVLGAAADVSMFINEPETRTPVNFGLSALGMLPFVPALSATRNITGRFEPRATIDPTNPETMISTRLPTAKGALEDPDMDLLLSDVPAARLSPEALGKNIDLMREYPGMGRLRSNAKPENVMSEFHAMVRDNLLQVYDRMPVDMRDAAKQWYEGANKIRGGMAREYDIPGDVASGVIAVLSPQKEWNTNVSLAERVIDTWKREQNTLFSPEMESAWKAIADDPKRIDPWRDVIGDLRGKSLAEVEGPEAKAAWIRLFDEAHNPRTYEVWSPDGTRSARATTMSGAESKAAWGSFREIGKAVAILDNPSKANISRQLGKQHKVRNFYNNIENPNADVPFYTSDTHNVAASLGSPMSGKSEAVAHSFGGGIVGRTGASSSALTGVQGTYPMLLEGGVSAAGERGVLPREMQSVSWEGIRNMFDAAFKSNPANKQAVRDVWTKFEKNQITRTEAWDILEEMTGGIKPPAWMD